MKLTIFSSVVESPVFNVLSRFYGERTAAPAIFEMWKSQ